MAGQLYSVALVHRGKWDFLPVYRFLIFHYMILENVFPILFIADETKVREAKMARYHRVRRKYGRTKVPGTKVPADESIDYSTIFSH